MKTIEAFRLHKEICNDNSLEYHSFRERYRTREDKDKAIKQPHMGKGGNVGRRRRNMKQERRECGENISYETYRYREKKSLLSNTK